MGAPTEARGVGLPLESYRLRELSSLIWVLGTKLRSIARAVHILDQRHLSGPDLSYFVCSNSNGQLVSVGWLFNYQLS
jgi:alpha-beta hydrolase superfamily lysophospholipase